MARQRDRDRPFHTRRTHSVRICGTIHLVREGNKMDCPKHVYKLLRKTVTVIVFPSSASFLGIRTEFASRKRSGFRLNIRLGVVEMCCSTFCLCC